MSLAHLTSNIGLLGFAIASVLYLMGVQKSEAWRWATPSAFTLFCGATVSVTICLALLIKESGLLDISGILLTSAVGWLAIAGHVGYGLKLMGAFVAPLATLLLLVQFFLVPMRLLSDMSTPDAILVKTHIAMAIFGQAFAIIACGISILFLWQQNLLKKKLLDQLPQSLPAIDRLEGLLTGSLWAGFVFITLGLLSGALFAQLNAVTRQNLDVKIIWAILVWAWYLATLLARNVFGRPSKRIAQMALGGFLLLAVTYFGMGILRPFGGG